MQKMCSQTEGLLSTRDCGPGFDVATFFAEGELHSLVNIVKY
jgi:hypothetical protein